LEVRGIINFFIVVIIVSKILVASDGSGSSEDAEQYVSQLYHPSRDEVVVVSVAHMPGIVGGETEEGMTETGVDVAEIDEKFRQQAKAAAEDAAERLRNEGFDVNVSIREGRPGPEICEVVDEEDIDVVMMGKRGQTDSEQPYLGSVSQYVVHNANCPVNVVPH
jgi:nucleotide-binding universal stress UspA family protein